MKGDGDRGGGNWICRLLNMAFESGVVLETEDLLLHLQRTRVKERGLTVLIIEVLACQFGWKNICREHSRQIL